MAITVIKAPQYIVPVKNDVWVEVETSLVGGKFQIRIQWWNLLVPHITTSIYSIDGNNRAKFNLKPILMAAGNPDFPLVADVPTYNQATATNIFGAIKDWHMYIDELDSSGALVSTVDILNNKVVLAGLSYEKFTNSNAYAALIGTGTTFRKFLTNRPLTKKVLRDQQEFLYYLHTDTHFGDGISMSIKATLYWTDGSTPTVVTKFTPTISLGNMYLIPAGFGQLNLAADEASAGKTIAKYEVYLYSTTPSAGNVTNVYTYEVDQVVCTDSRYFLFLNSLGGMDTIHCRVVEEYQVAVETTRVERSIPDGYAVSDGQFFELDKKVTRKFKVTTGLLSKAERLYLRELFLSSKVLEITDSQYLPVILNNNSVQLHKGPADMQSITFDYEYAFDDNAY